MYQAQRKSLGEILMDQKALQQARQADGRADPQDSDPGSRSNKLVVLFGLFILKHQLRGEPGCFPQGQESGQTENHLG